MDSRFRGNDGWWRSDCFNFGPMRPDAGTGHPE